MELETIPAYRRAKERGTLIEERLRVGAFLPVPQKICGIECLQLTLRIVLRLTWARNPLMVGGRIASGHVLAFLWAVSPGYSLKSRRAKEKAKDALALKAACIPFRQAVRGIRRYLYLAWIDRPPTARARRGIPPAVAFAASMCHHIAHAYKWDDEAVLDKPLARLYQYLVLIRLEANPKAPTFNPIVDRLTRPIRNRLLNPK